MNPTARYRLIGFALAVLVFIADQAVKAAMIGPLALHDRGVIDILPFFDFRWTENYGVSLGLFTAQSNFGRWVLVAVTGAIAAVVTFWLLRERKLGDIVPLGLILGGALGNITDRVRLGFVVDYADLHFGEFRPFMIFNLADAAITFGVLIILARSLLSGDKPSEPANPAPES